MGSGEEREHARVCEDPWVWKADLELGPEWGGEVEGMQGP